MKYLKCISVNPGFEEIFKANRKYRIVEKAPNGLAWHIQRTRGESLTFVAVNSVFGVFEEVGDD